MKKRHILLRSSVLFLILILQPQSTLAGNCKGEQFRQLLRDLMNDAELQVKDALYPITRYAGMGYNLLRGNPEGDFFNGGKDPGIHNTRWILNLTYTQNKEGHYRGQTVAIPDQVEFHPTRTCFARSMTKAFSGQSSYQDQLKRNIKLGLSGGYAKLAELGFSLSSGMEKAETMTKDKREVIIQKTEICNLGRARYKEELIVDGLNPYILSEGFKNAVKALPDSYDEREYLQFIERWGTDVIMSADVGTRLIERQSAEYSDLYRYLYKKKSKGGSLKLGGGVNGIGASGDIGIDLSTLNKNINKKTKLGHSKTCISIGSKREPAPILLKLRPISKALDSFMWGPTWVDDAVPEKKINIEKILLRYPDIVKAHVDKDPKITVVPELRWLSGEFAMPRPQRGCPEGFSWGNLTQDTTNTFHDNSWSDGIANHLLVNVKADKITTSFCVKTSEHASFNEPHYELPWPSGSYCIGRRNGFCPDGFGMGFIQWDDKDIFNENSHSGELPDGKYGKDTKIFFCCRSDAETSVAMTMPTARPFILYRHGGACQIVAGMKVKEDYIEWISNTHKLLFNKNAVYGLHPDDDGGKRRYRLHYCHYSAKD